jgi:hypothetical protein
MLRFSNDEWRNPVAQNVSQQLEESEYLQEHKKRRQDEGEVQEKIPHHQIVENHGKSCAEHAAPLERALEGVFRTVEADQLLSPFRHFALQRVPTGAK